MLAAGDTLLLHGSWGALERRIDEPDLLAVELAVRLSAEAGTGVSFVLAGVFFALSMVFVWRSFYGMRIGSQA